MIGATAIALAMLAAPSMAQPVPITDAGFSASLSGIRTAVSESLTRKVDRPQPQDDGPLQIGVDRLDGPVPARSEQSCAGASGLEKSKFTLGFETERGELYRLFTYAGCKEEPRNDYLPPYVERYYKAADGYSMTLVTDEGADSSAVVVSYKGPGMKSHAVWTYGTVSNEKLQTSGTVDLGQVDAMDYREPGKPIKAKARLQVQAAPAAK